MNLKGFRARRGVDVTHLLDLFSAVVLVVLVSLSLHSTIYQRIRVWLKCAEKSTARACRHSNLHGSGAETLHGEVGRGVLSGTFCGGAEFVDGGIQECCR